MDKKEIITYAYTVIGSCLLTFFLFTFQLVQFLNITPKTHYYVLPLVVGAVFGFLLGKVKIDSTKIKTLTGMIPICSYCHKIRNKEGGWGRLEQYIEHHSTASFSHGICQECKSVEMEKIESKKEELNSNTH